MSRTRVYERELLKREHHGNATSNPAYPNDVHSIDTKSGRSTVLLSEKKHRSSLDGSASLRAKRNSMKMRESVELHSTEDKVSEGDAVESSINNQTDSKDGNMKHRLKRSKLSIVKDWSTGVEEFKKGNYEAALHLFKVR
jgi:hypothetical protein